MDNEILYIYDDHLGNGYYVTDEELDYDSLYCEQCGDSDNLVYMGTKDQILNSLDEEIEDIKNNEESSEWELDQAYQEKEYVKKLLG